MLCRTAKNAANVVLLYSKDNSEEQKSLPKARNITCLEFADCTLLYFCTVSPVVTLRDSFFIYIIDQSCPSLKSVRLLFVFISALLHQKRVVLSITLSEGSLYCFHWIGRLIY